MQVTCANTQSFLRLLNIKPLRILKLRVMLQMDLLMRGITALRNRTDHQVRRVRPGLRRMNNDTSKRHTSLFPDFSTDGIFDRLRRLNKPGQGRVPFRRESLRPAEQDALAIGRDDRHDDGGVGAGEGQVRNRVSGVTRGTLLRQALRSSCSVCRRANALRAGVDGQRGVPAGSAEGIAVVPVVQRARLCVDSSY